MALSDPQTVTIAATATSLARTDLAKNKGSFISADGLVEMNVSTSFSPKAGASTLARLDLRKKTVDAVTGVTRVNTASAWIVVRRPDNGTFSVTELSDLAKGLATYVSGANFPRILVGEA